MYIAGSRPHPGSPEGDNAAVERAHTQATTDCTTTVG